MSPLGPTAKIGQNFLGAPPLVPPRVSPGIVSRSHDFSTVSIFLHPFSQNSNFSLALPDISEEISWAKKRRRRSANYERKSRLCGWFFSLFSERRESWKSNDQRRGQCSTISAICRCLWRFPHLQKTQSEWVISIERSCSLKTLENVFFPSFFFIMGKRKVQDYCARFSAPGIIDFYCRAWRRRGRNCERRSRGRKNFDIARITG